jgi:predicted dehydrogenase
MIDDGLIGDLVSAEFRVPWWRDQDYYNAPGRGTFERDGGGVMITQAIHTLDLATWLMGSVRSVSAVMATTSLHTMEAEDWAGGLFEFENGAVATMTATTSFFPGCPESIRVQGTKAHAHLENGVLTVSYLDGRIETIGATSDGTGGGADPMAFTHVWHQRVIEDFADCLRTGRTPLCPVRDGLKAQAIIEAMQLSSKTRQAVRLKT